VLVHLASEARLVPDTDPTRYELAVDRLRALGLIDKMKSAMR